MPYVKHVGISRKIEDETEKERQEYKEKQIVISKNREILRGILG